MLLDSSALVGLAAGPRSPTEGSSALGNGSDPEALSSGADHIGSILLPEPPPVQPAPGDVTDAVEAGAVGVGRLAASGPDLTDAEEGGASSPGGLSDKATCATSPAGTGAGAVDPDPASSAGPASLEASDALVRAQMWRERADFCSAHVGHRGAAVVAECLSRADCPVETLGLGANPIGGQGVVAIAAALERNTRVTKLFLHFDDIGNAGAAAIASMLRANSTLQVLDLGGCDIGQAGVCTIAAALAENRGLQRLQLADAGDVGAATVAAALRRNSSLVMLKLIDCRIGPDGATALFGALQSNQTLRFLDLSNNPFDCDGEQAAGAAAGATHGIDGGVYSDGVLPTWLEDCCAHLEQHPSLQQVRVSNPVFQQRVDARLRQSANDVARWDLRSDDEGIGEFAGADRFLHKAPRLSHPQLPCVPEQSGSAETDPNGGHYDSEGVLATLPAHLVDVATGDEPFALGPGEVGAAAAGGDDAAWQEHAGGWH